MRKYRYEYFDVEVPNELFENKDGTVDPDRADELAIMAAEDKANFWRIPASWTVTSILNQGFEYTTFRVCRRTYYHGA